MKKNNDLRISLVIIASLLIVLLTSCAEINYVGDQPTKVRNRIKEMNSIIIEKDSEKLLDLFTDSYKEIVGLNSEDDKSFLELYNSLPWLKKADDFNIKIENIDIVIKDIIMSIDAENAIVYTYLKGETDDNAYEVCFHLVRINNLWYIDNVYVK